MSNSQNKTFKLNKNENILKRNILINKRIETNHTSTSTKDIIKTIYPSKQLKIKILNLPTIYSKSIETSPRYNHNRKVIKIKKIIFENDFKKNNSQDKLILTSLKQKLKNGKTVFNINKKHNILTQQLSERNYNLFKNNTLKNQQFGVSELLINDIKDLENETKSLYKRNIILSPNLNDLFLNKLNHKKKPKKIKELNNINYSMKNIRDMTNCYLDFQNKNNISNFKLANHKLNNVEKKINNIFNVIRNEVDFGFKELLNDDKIEFHSK